MNAAGDVAVSGACTPGMAPTANPLRAWNNSGYPDIFVTKVGPDHRIVYSTPLGGEDVDLGGGVTIGPDGSVIVVGDSFSRDFVPIKNAFQTSLSQFFGDLTITKLSDTPVVDPPEVLSVTGKLKGATLAKLKIKGSNLQTGIQVFVGLDTTSWSAAMLKSTSSLTLKGADLDTRFPAGTAVPIKVRNPDGGEAITTFTRQ